MRRRAPRVEAAGVASGFTGPWAIRSEATAPGPRNRLTRARMSADWCCTSRAAAPATRSSSVPPAPPRPLVSFCGRVTRAS